VEGRLARARETARIAASILRDRFGAKRVIVFGSVVRPECFTPWSDIDLAAWGIPADQFFRAVGALSGLSEEFKVDLVDPEGCRPTLREEIDREGEEP
jgi:predicted nucleotidyltransferase